MSLRRKVALVLFMAVAVFVGVDNFLHKENFEHRFRKLDWKTAERNLRAAESGMAEQTGKLAQTAQQLLGSLPPGDQAMELNLNAATRAFDLDVLVVFDALGVVRFHHVHNGRNGKPMVLRDLPNESLSPHQVARLSSPVQTSAEETGPTIKSGLLPTVAGTLLVGSSSILRQDGTEMRLLAGRFLDLDILEALSYHSDTKVEVTLAQAFMETEESQDLLDQLLSNSEGRTVVEKGESIRGTALLRGIDGAPTLALHASVPRTMGNLWTDLRHYSILSMISLSVLCPLVLLLLVQWIVTGPLRTLTDHAVRIGSARSSGLRMNMVRGDEIGRLAHEFDAMLDQLDHSREEVIKSARLAGMSDLSVGVLHNVGNLLNHVSVTANLSRDAAKELPLKDLQALAQAVQLPAEELQHFLTTDERGRNLPQFLQALTQDIQVRAESLRTESLAVSDGIGDVARLIATLEESGSCMGVIESVCLEEQVDSVLELCAMSVSDGSSIQITRAYAYPQRVDIDRHRFIEIMVNVVRNAMESVLECGAQDPALTVSIHAVPAGTIMVEVQDNGLGIAQGDLDRVFASGFSSKDNSQGLGLHLASTAAIELGGGLRAESPGLGQGANFCLSLPLGQQRSAQAA